MKSLCHPGLRRKGGGPGLQRERKQLTGRMKRRTWFSKQMFGGLSEAMGHQEDFNQTGLLVSSLPAT